MNLLIISAIVLSFLIPILAVKLNDKGKNLCILLRAIILFCFSYLSYRAACLDIKVSNDLVQGVLEMAKATSIAFLITAAVDIVMAIYELLSKKE